MTVWTKEKLWQRIRSHPPRGHLEAWPPLPEAWQALVDDGLLRREPDSPRGGARYAISHKGWQEILAWERRVSGFFARKESGPQFPATIWDDPELMRKYTGT